MFATLRPLDPADPVALTGGPRREARLVRGAPPVRPGTPPPAPPRRIAPYELHAPVSPQEVIAGPPPVRQTPPPFERRDVRTVLPRGPEATLAPAPPRTPVAPPPAPERLVFGDPELVSATDPTEIPVVGDPDQTIVLDPLDDDWFDAAPRSRRSTWALALAGGGAVVGLTMLAAAGAIVAIVAG